MAHVAVHRNMEHTLETGCGGGSNLCLIVCGAFVAVLEKSGLTSLALKKQARD